MYRGLTTFSCTNCGHQFKSHDIEYRATAFSVLQRCPKCGSVRTMPDFWIEVGGMKFGINIYESIWEEIEEAERKRKERIRHAEAKRKADEEQQSKKRAKKRKHMSRKQREAYFFASKTLQFHPIQLFSYFYSPDSPPPTRRLTAWCMRFMD